MNRIFSLYLPMAMGVVMLGQISTANGAVDPKAAAARGGARAAAPRAAHVAAAPHFAARPATPRFAARTPQRSFAARPSGVATRSVAHRNFSTGPSVTQSRISNRATLNRTATAQNRITNRAAFNRNAGTQNRMANGTTFNRGNRNLALRQTTNANRVNTAAIAGNQVASTAVSNRRNIASNQFAFRSGNFHRGWNPARSYVWNHHHWRNYNGVWAVYDAGWPDDWYGYPYPFAYDNSVYYDGNVYDPGIGAQPAAVGESPNSVVSSVQSDLAAQGYNPGPADGIPGPQTEQAIAQYQQDNGMPATGQIDSTLLDSLGL